MGVFEGRCLEDSREAVMDRERDDFGEEEGDSVAKDGSRTRSSSRDENELGGSDCLRSCDGSEFVGITEGGGRTPADREDFL